MPFWLLVGWLLVGCWLVGKFWFILYSVVSYLLSVVCYQ
jgi:hypothetical protein